MTYAVTALLFLIVIAVVIALVRFFESRNLRPWITAEEVEHEDPVMGSYVVELPVVGQNQSRGVVRLERVIGDDQVQFSHCYSDPTGGTEGLDEAVSELRRFFLMAHHTEKMKVFKNATLSVMDMHRLLFPNSPLSDDQMISSLKLWTVSVLSEDQAWFRFSSKVFMQDAPIYVTVTSEGEVASVGVG